MGIKNGIEGANKFFGSIAEFIKGDFRKNAITTEINGIVIDTVCSPDTQKWETGIDKGSGFIIVEQYENMEETTKGHNKWCEKVKKGERNFKDIDLWGLDKNELG